MQKDLYNDLSSKYTAKELAEAFVFPDELTGEAKKIADKEFVKLRMDLLKNRTEEDKIFSDLVRLHILMKDYLKTEPYNHLQSFGFYLGEYIAIVKKSKKEFAQDLGIHYTRLSRILNNREEPNIELCYRLETHSGELIPALSWWKLMVKKQEYLILQDNQTRKIEAAKVKNEFKFNRA
ncbi:MAG: helix-turn-helix domain-containing protein [Saprospiraceae bacterium]